MNDACRVVETTRLQYSLDLKPGFLPDSQRFIIHRELGVYQVTEKCPRNNDTYAEYKNVPWKRRR